MAKTVIKISNLSTKEIDNAIKELEKYRKSFDEKCDELCKRVAERIQKEAQDGFSVAIVDDLTAKSGGARKASVTVTSSKNDNGGYVVRANGKDAVWVEFGAGVHHNGSVGSSPNPYGSELGFSIGGYGKNGSKDKWAFSEGGDTKWSYGTPASMPMYKAVRTVVNDIEKIAKEVFG